MEMYYKPYSTLYDLSVVYTDITDESSYFTSGEGQNSGIDYYTNSIIIKLMDGLDIHTHL